MSNDTELRIKIKAVLKQVDLYRIAMVQCNIRKLDKDEQKKYLYEKTTIGRSGLDMDLWTEEEILKIIKESK